MSNNSINNLNNLEDNQTIFKQIIVTYDNTNSVRLNLSRQMKPLRSVSRSVYFRTIPSFVFIFKIIIEMYSFNLVIPKYVWYVTKYVNALPSCQ